MANTTLGRDDGSAATHENPARRRDRARRGDIQAIALPKARFTLARARSYLKARGWSSRKVHETPHFWRFRQRDPGQFRSFFIIKTKSGAHLVVGSRETRAAFLTRKRREIGPAAVRRRYGPNRQRRVAADYYENPPPPRRPNYDDPAAEPTPETPRYVYLDRVGLGRYNPPPAAQDNQFARDPITGARVRRRGELPPVPHDTERNAAAERVRLAWERGMAEGKFAPVVKQPSVFQVERELARRELAARRRKARREKPRANGDDVYYFDD